jgi:hypothetical protein
MAHPAAVLGPIGKSAGKFLLKTLDNRERTEQLEGLLRETMYRSVRDELLGNPRYEFTAEDDRRDEQAIRSAVKPIVAAALTCAKAELTRGRKFSLRAILNSMNRRTDDLGSLSEFSAREKLKSWLTCGVKTVYTGGRFSTDAGAPPIRAGALEQWGKWWDALVDINYPVVTRAVDQFRDIVQHAADDRNGSDSSRRFAQRLDDELTINDRRREKRRATVTSAVAGFATTTTLLTVEVIDSVRDLLPATIGVAGVSLALVAWLAARERATPTADQIQELSMAIDSVRDWTLNVEQSREGDEQRLLRVLEQWLLPSLEPFDVRLLRATLLRVRGLLEDRHARAPSFQLANLDSAIRELHRLIDPPPPPTE